ncbi:MAG: hypothetical protein ACNYNY_04210 [Candidatus Oxydemutatoraceae bacterium WSBS_2016_MAG_OTU14]
MEHHIKNGDQIMFNTNSAHKAILCPKNFLIVLTALVCFLSSAVVSAQEAQMLSPISQTGLIPGDSCDAGLTENIEGCIQVTDNNLDSINTDNISRALAPNPSNTSLFGIVDWVVVEVRVFDQGADVTASPGDARTIYRQAALLRSDGTIINADAEDLLAADAVLTLGLEGFDDSTQDAYVAIEHRVHLGVMSANPVTPETEYDFGSSDTQLFQGASNATLKSGVWSATSGDTNSDGQIFPDDSLNSLGEQGRGGYNLIADTNGDGQSFPNDTLVILSAQGRTQSYTSCIAPNCIAPTPQN